MFKRCVVMSASNDDGKHKYNVVVITAFTDLVKDSPEMVSVAKSVHQACDERLETTFRFEELRQTVLTCRAHIPDAFIVLVEGSSLDYTKEAVGNPDVYIRKRVVGLPKSVGDHTLVMTGLSCSEVSNLVKTDQVLTLGKTGGRYRISATFDLHRYDVRKHYVLRVPECSRYDTVFFRWHYSKHDEVMKKMWDVFKCPTLYSIDIESAMFALNVFPEEDCVSQPPIIGIEGRCACTDKPHVL